MLWLPRLGWAFQVCTGLFPVCYAQHCHWCARLLSNVLCRRWRLLPNLMGAICLCWALLAG